jgi:hypothetical protein
MPVKAAQRVNPETGNQHQAGTPETQILSLIGATFLAVALLRHAAC